MKNFIDENAKKWVIYAFYGLFAVGAINSCNSCNRNSEMDVLKKEIKSLNGEIDTLTLELNATNKIIENLPDTMQANDDKQTAKFLYWERQADKPSYKDYTIKDYYDAIKK